MKKIPYLVPELEKMLAKIEKKGTAVLVTHSSNFHADDICATATIKTFLGLVFPKVKIKVIRSIDPKDWAKGDFVYDIGMIYDPKTLRFDHHQEGGAGMYENGIKYSSFGLIWKHFGLSLCAVHTAKITGKVPTKKVAERQAEIIQKRVVAHVDGMDNGQMTYKALFDGVDVFTIDGFFEMCKMTVASLGADVKTINKEFDRQFGHMVQVFSGMIQSILIYAYKKQIDEGYAIKAYEKSKDKRIVICDRFFYFNYGKFPEPLVTVYPDTRGGWAAKNVKKKEDDYEARFYFPEAWAGKTGEELAKVTGVPGSVFCHNGRFLIVADTKEAVLQMVKRAFNE